MEHWLEYGTEVAVTLVRSSICAAVDDDDGMKSLHCMTSSVGQPVKIFSADLLSGWCPSPSTASLAAAGSSSLCRCPDRFLGHVLVFSSDSIAPSPARILSAITDVDGGEPSLCEWGGPYRQTGLSSSRGCPDMTISDFAGDDQWWRPSTGDDVAGADCKHIWRLRCVWTDCMACAAFSPQ